MNAKVAKRGANASACAPRRAPLGSPLPEGAFFRAPQSARQAPLHEGGGAPAPGGVSSALRRQVSLYLGPAICYKGACKTTFVDTPTRRNPL